MKSQNLRTMFKRPVSADAEDGRRRCSKEVQAASRGWKRQEHGLPLKPHRKEATLATLRDTHFRLLTMEMRADSLSSNEVVSDISTSTSRGVFP